MFCPLMGAFSLFSGWHLPLKGHVSSWCLKEDSPMAAIPGSCFPRPLPLGEFFSPSLLCPEGHILSQGAWPKRS